MNMQGGSTFSLATLLGQMTAGGSWRSDVPCPSTSQLDRVQELLRDETARIFRSTDTYNSSSSDDLSTVPAEILTYAAQQLQGRISSGLHRFGRVLHELPDATGLFYEEKIEGAEQLLHFTEDWYREFLFKRFQFLEGSLTREAYQNWFESRFTFFESVKNRLRRRLDAEQSRIVVAILSSASQLAARIGMEGEPDPFDRNREPSGGRDSLSHFGLGYTVSLARGELAQSVLESLRGAANFSIEEDEIVLTPFDGGLSQLAQDQSIRIYLRILGWELVPWEQVPLEIVPAAADTISGTWRLRTFLKVEEGLARVREELRRGRIEYLQRFDKTDSDSLESRRAFAVWAVSEGKRLGGLIDEMGEWRKLLPNGDSATSNLKMAVNHLCHDERGGVRHIIGFGELFLAHTNEDYWKRLRQYAEAFRPVGLNVASFFERLFQFHLGDADRQNVHLHVMGADRIDFGLEVDQEMLSIILNNAVGNAIKYKKPDQTGFVVITVDGSKNSIRIQDDGIGMEPSFVAHPDLGKKRLREERAHGVDGTGTGMKLMHQTAKRLGYTLSIESRVSQGTTIMIQMKEGDLVVVG